MALAAPHTAAAAEGGDDADLARLLDVEVEGASRYAQSTLDAPAVVRVFQRADAALLGHETVGDLLQRLPGVYLTTNRAYTSFGLRGFNRASDYNSRTLMTIDGLRVNDAIFDQGLPGQEFPIPADWVKRTELVYGPAASVYGSNALLGVVNFAMLDGADAPGIATRASAGSFGRARAAVSYGLADPDGIDLFVGAVAYRDRGEDLRFPELASDLAPDGVARGLDGMRHHSLFAKLRAGPWRASLVSHERDKDIATGEFDTSFGAPGTHYVDTYRFAELGYDGGWMGRLRPSARLALGSYSYIGHYRYDAGTPDDQTNIDDLSGRWLDGEAKLQWHGWTNHVVVAGLDWRRVFSARLLNHDVGVPAELDRRVDNWRAGLYLQDQWRVAERWSVTTGLRLDHLGAGSPEFSPRLAVIYRPDADDAWKLSLGRAFRAPNIAELYYEDGTSQAANPSLGLEHIATVELGWEHALSAGVRLSASLYRYQLGRMIDFVVPADSEIGQYRNVGQASTNGLDLDLEQAAESAWRWRASMTLSRSTIDGQPATNSPRWLLKGHLLAPLAPAWWLGLEANAVGRRTAEVDVPAYAVFNGVLRYEPHRGNALALRITNLGDTEAYDVTTPGLSVLRVPRPRRALTLDWTLAF